MNLKEKPQVSNVTSGPVVDDALLIFDLAPDSTITNTTSSENLDVTENPLFLIVNWTSPFTIVCSFLVFKNPRKFLSNGKKVLNYLI